MSTNLSDLVSHLRASRDAHLALGKYILAADQAALFPLDFLAVAVLNRSLALIDGFCSLVESRNFIAAAPLLRLQLDNCLRFSAAWLVEKPHDLAMEVLRGTPVRKLRARDGRFMSDRYLVERLGVEVSWIESVYEQTSGYIHLSEKHMFAAIRASESEDRHISMRIGYKDDLPEHIYLEAVSAFIEATYLLLKYAHGWGFTKDNPEQVSAWKREMGGGAGA